MEVVTHDLLSPRPTASQKGLGDLRFVDGRAWRQLLGAQCGVVVEGTARW